MRDDLQSLLALGDADLGATLGEAVAMARLGTVYASGVRAVITPGGVSYDLKIGGEEIQYTATCDIPKHLLPQRPKPSDTLTASDGTRYTVTRVTGAPWDTSYHLDLAQ